MPSPLQKAPQGWLGALALKVLGGNPNQVSDAVVPIVDIYDQYLAQEELQVRNVVFTLLAATTSNTGFLTVPTGKCWRVIAAGIGTAINAADAALLFDANLQVVPPGAVAGFTAVYAAAALLGTTTGRSMGVYLGPRLFLPSGWGLACGLTTRAAAPANNVSVSFNALVQQFDL